MLAMPFHSQRGKQLPADVRKQQNVQSLSERFPFLSSRNQLLQISGCQLLHQNNNIIEIRRSIYKTGHSPENHLDGFLFRMNKIETETPFRSSSSEDDYLLSTNDRQSKQYHGSAVNSAGANFNMLCNETITQYLSSESELKTGVLKKQLKKIEEFDLKPLALNQCISYWSLSKLYYIEEKLKESRGFALTKFSKQKNVLIEKIRHGLRNYDHLQKFYSQTNDPFLEKNCQQSTKQKQSGSPPELQDTIEQEHNGCNLAKPAEQNKEESVFPAESG